MKAIRLILSITVLVVYAHLQAQYLHLEFKLWYLYLILPLVPWADYIYNNRSSILIDGKTLINEMRQRLQVIKKWRETWKKGAILGGVFGGLLWIINPHVAMWIGAIPFFILGEGIFKGIPEWISSIIQISFPLLLGALIVGALVRAPFRFIMALVIGVFLGSVLPLHSTKGCQDFACAAVGLANVGFWVILSIIVLQISWKRDK